MRPLLALLVLAVCACLSRRALPDAPAPTAVHETRKGSLAGGEAASFEHRLLVWSDGRVERDGPEREYAADGVLVAERHYTHGEPDGIWRTWYRDGTPRSEVAFGRAHRSQPGTSRYWHANGRLSAEGPTVAGLREGRWSFWDEDGTPIRRGGYRAGKRDGPWTFYDERAAPRAQGNYALGQRVGEWTLWDESGVAHVKHADGVEPDLDRDP